MLVKKVMQEMNDLIEHHQLQVINLEEMLEEERQAAQMNENAANHVIAELRKEISRYRERIEYMLEEAKDHKRKGLRIQHWALIKDLEEALEESK